MDILSSASLQSEFQLESLSSSNFFPFNLSRKTIFSLKNHLLPQNKLLLPCLCTDKNLINIPNATKLENVALWYRAGNVRCVT